jgi:hypothetical protein
MKTISRAKFAESLGCDEKSLRRWEVRPDAPKERDLDTWRAYIEAQGLAKGMTGKSYAELREDKIREEIALLALKRKKEEGKTYDAADVKRYLSQLGAKWHQLLTQKLEVDIPARLLGKNIVEARAEARAVHDEIREICNAGIVEAESEMQK